MEIPEVFKLVVEGLKLFGVTEKCAMCIMFLLKTEEQELAMLEWITSQIDNNKIPTENECLEQAVKITQDCNK